MEDVEDKEDEGIGKDDDDDEVDEPLPCQMCMTVPSMLCAGSHPEGRQRVREQKARDLRVAQNRATLMNELHRVHGAMYGRLRAERREFATFNSRSKS